MLNENCQLLLTSKDSSGREIYIVDWFLFFLNSYRGRVTHRSLFANCSDLLSLCLVLHCRSPRSLSKWLSLFFCHFFPFFCSSPTSVFLRKKMVLWVSDYTWTCHSNFHIPAVSNLITCTWWSTILVDWSQYFAYCQTCYHYLPHLFSEVFQESIPGSSLACSTY